MTNPTHSQIGNHIRKLRLSKGKSLTETAKSSGISKGYLSSIETGRKTPDYEVIQGICSVLDVKTHELLLLAYFDESINPECLDTNLELIRENIEVLKTNLNQEESHSTKEYMAELTEA